MKLCSACIINVLIVVTNAGAVQTKEHPIVRVINLMEGLIAKVELEGKAEELAYEKFVYQCGVNKESLTKAIEAESALIDELSDTIDAKTNSIEVLTADIADLEAESAENAATITKQQAARNATNALYLKTKGELDSTINAIEEAISALEGAEKTTEAADSRSLIQIKMRRALTLVRRQGKVLPTGYLADHIDKYDFKSENVIELLKKLLSGFQEQLVTTNSEETNSLNAHALAENNLESVKAAIEKSLKTKNASKIDAETDLEAAETSKKDTEDDKAADTASLDTTEKACKLKADEWDKRSATREGEIAAMQAAINIMSKVSGVRSKAPVNPVPPPSPSAFLQLAAAPKKGSHRRNAISRVMSLLRKTASAEHSKLLEELAMQVSAKLSAPYDDFVFQPVINQIEKMIFHLQEEQTAEDEHKHWCDKELAMTEAMLSDKSDKIKTLKLKLGVENAAIQKLTSDIQANSEMIAKIVEYMAEATEVRKVGKKENKLALEDAEDAQAALANAIAVLTEFYKSSGAVDKAAWEFLQQTDPVSLPEDPKTWESEYTGAKHSSLILAVLEKVSDDFASMANEIKGQEAADQKAYDEEMSKMDIDKAEKTQNVKEKELEKSHRLSLSKEMAAELKHVTGEFDQSHQYLKDLQKACVDSDSTYDDRKAARDREIEALKEAEVILTDAFKQPTEQAEGCESGSVYVNHVNDNPGAYTCDCVKTTDPCFDSQMCLEEPLCPNMDGQPVKLLKVDKASVKVAHKHSTKDSFGVAAASEKFVEDIPTQKTLADAKSEKVPDVTWKESATETNFLKIRQHHRLA